MAAVTICSDFGAQENKICHCFHFFPIYLPILSSVQFICSVMSDSLQPNESQHARPPCPSPTPRVHSDSRPSSQWCHPAISFSVIPFSSCPQFLPASEFFPVSQLFTWGGQSTGVSALASFPPKKSQGWSLSEWTGWIFLQSKGLSRIFSNYVLIISITSGILTFSIDSETQKFSVLCLGSPSLNQGEESAFKHKVGQS